MFAPFAEKPPPTRDAITGDVDESLYCSDLCRDLHQQEYDAYINREMARAAREFRNRTPEQKERVKSWNVWADRIDPLRKGIAA